MQIVRIGDGSTKRHSAETVGAKAANLARMAALGLPVPPAFVLPVNLCAAIVRRRSPRQAKADRRSARGNCIPRGAPPASVRRPAPAAAGVGAFRRRAIDARNVGYGARRRLYVGGGSRSRAHDRPSALCLGLPAPVSRKLRRCRPRHRPGVACRARLAELVAAEGVESEQALDGEAIRASRGILPADDRGRGLRGVRRSDGATRGRSASGLPLVDERSCPHLSSA